MDENLTRYLVLNGTPPSIRTRVWVTTKGVDRRIRFPGRRRVSGKKGRYGLVRQSGSISVRENPEEMLFPKTFLQKKAARNMQLFNGEKFSQSGKSSTFVNPHGPIRMQD
ncbi:hypothetical protein CEXT_409331 [Caerostris extrusa]|uniref:Uncharacterized protein n=1 Tax=Caerostris extrusa TaxID=172846 RepID=A0AAV4RTG8_CAEEX|nr:hypothetical protein CEXT_409331 [Caerostris extrusa]